MRFEHDAGRLQAMKPSAILYDFDGTLVDTLPGIEVAATAAANLENPLWKLPPLRPLIGPPLRGMLEIALPEAESPQLDRIALAFKQLYDGGMCLECAPYPDVESTLRALHCPSASGEPGIRAFIVTNKRTVPTNQLLRHFGLDDIFEAVVASDSPPGFASKSLALAWTMAEFGLGAAESLFVGDSRDDFVAAADNGLPFLPVTYGYGEASAHSASVPLHHFADLPTMLASLFPLAV